ncbi:MAG: CapA family protein [Saprospiraceae bacterium]|nr:CapA family protein [Saprospiraceae bacterium]
MKCCLTLIFVCFLALSGHTQSDTLQLTFLGDIMGHEAQIHAAFQAETQQYDYWPSFKEIAPILRQADFTIGNLEVTLSGKPFHGYPVFSSPDALAVACQKAGINVLLTANNHALDFSSRGLIRTIDVLDSLGIKHTGSFHSKAARRIKNLLILHKNNIRLGLLNYTFSTNGIRIPKSVAVNKIDTLQMKKDIQRAKRTNIDKLIVFMHWGKEYENMPHEKQRTIAQFLKRQKVDIIIGAHPHVLQPMEFSNRQIIAYSLGNFLTAQRNTGKDGGALLHITIVKNEKSCKLIRCEYELTWVHCPAIENKKQFVILPAKSYETSSHLDNYAQMRLNRFLKSARTFLAQHNVHVKER